MLDNDRRQIIHVVFGAMEGSPICGRIAPKYLGSNPENPAVESQDCPQLEDGPVPWAHSLDVRNGSKADLRSPMSAMGGRGNSNRSGRVRAWPASQRRQCKNSRTQRSRRVTLFSVRRHGPDQTASNLEQANALEAIELLR